MWVGRAWVLGAALLLTACQRPSAPRVDGLPTDAAIRRDMQQLSSPGARCEAGGVKLQSGDTLKDLDLVLLGTSVYVVGKQDVLISGLWVECVGDQPGVVVVDSQHVTIVNSVFFNCERAVSLRRALDVLVDNSLFVGSRTLAAFYGWQWSGALSNSRMTASRAGAVFLTGRLRDGRKFTVPTDWAVSRESES